MKIVMVAGGSGGHIYPALALAEELETRGHEITFLGSKDRMEKDVIPAAGFPYIGLDVYTTRGGLLQKVKSLSSIVLSYRKCLKLLKGYDLAIGFGNYISVPVLLAAVKLGMKTVIHEQNSFVGRANRVLDQKVDLIISSYEEDRAQFKNPNNLVLGNPQMSKAYKVKKDPKILEEMGLSPEKKTVVIFMGSLGSESVNKELLRYFELSSGDYQIVYATGKSNYAYTMEHAPKKDHLRIYERIDGAAVMKNADLLISRAGATTLCEIAAIGIPSILIPSPFVPNNHQYYNGKALVDKDAAVMIEEKDLTAEKLNDLVNEIIHDDARLKQLGENAKAMGNEHVLENIVEAIEHL